MRISTVFVATTTSVLALACSSGGTLAEWCRDATTVSVAGLPAEATEFVVESSDFTATCTYEADEFECEGTSEGGVHGSFEQLWFYAPFTASEITLTVKSASGGVVAQAVETPETKFDEDCGKESRSASVTFELGGAGGGPGGGRTN